MKKKFLSNIWLSNEWYDQIEYMTLLKKLAEKTENYEDANCYC